ncbi:MAG: hypothetical protein AAF125_18025, partial [Chloroflexota bacterium]
LDLEVRSSTLPTTPDGQLTVRIVVGNATLGTVPFIYNPDAVIVGNNNTPGLGIIFEPASNIVTPGINQRITDTTYQMADIRLLGPQQRCVHTMTFAANQLDGNITGGNATVQAYYQGTSPGVVPATNPTPIYPDQGLPTGTTLSNPVTILAP